MSSETRSPPLALIAGLIFAAVLGGGAVWLLLGDSEHFEPPPVTDRPRAEPAPPPRETEAVVEPIIDPYKAMRPHVQPDLVELALQRQQAMGIQPPRPYEPGMETHTFQGRVVDADTGKPVNFVEIFLVPSEQGDIEELAKTIVPDKQRPQDGVFSIHYLVEGSYNLLVRTRTHKDWKRENLHVPTGGVVDVRLERGTYVYGFVKDSWGTPQENVEVFLRIEQIQPGSQRPQKTLAKTGKDGFFDFPKLPTGTYSLAAGPMGDPDCIVPSFYVGLDEQVDKTVEIPTRVTLKMEVLNSLGKGVPRAKVTLTSEENRSSNRWAHSNLEGLAYLRYVEQGSYTLQIRAPGYEVLQEDFEVPWAQGLQEASRVLKVATAPDG